MSNLFLIRHGQGSFGTADYDLLSDKGCRQARVLGTFFVQAGIRFDACWSGTLKRQRQTAREVGEAFREGGPGMPDPIQTPALNEYDYEAVLRSLVPLIVNEDPEFNQDVGDMLSDRRAFQKVFGRVMTRWASGRDKLNEICSWSSFGERVTSGIGEIMQGCDSGSQVAVFTSGGPIAALIGSVLKLPPEHAIALSWQLVNASVSRFKFSRGRISMASFNEQGHLERPGDHSLVTYR